MLYHKWSKLFIIKTSSSEMLTSTARPSLCSSKEYEVEVYAGYKILFSYGASRWLTTIVVLIGYLLIFYLNRQSVIQGVFRVLPVCMSIIS